MNKANQIQKNIKPRQVTLYRNVFYSRVSTAVVLCLCTSFLLQPIERVYAVNQLETENTTNEILNLAVDSGLHTAVPTEEILNTVTENIDDPFIVLDSDSSVSESETFALANTDTVLVTDANDDETAAIATSSFANTATSSSSTTTTTMFTPEEIEELIAGDNTPIVYDEDLVEEFATTSINLVAVSTVFSDAVMQFNKNDCVTVEDGSFYCQNKKEEVEQGTDGMYSLQDKDGDLEIFLQKNGELTQLTFNTVDDAAPYFDVRSNTIVWHRLVDERYQIIAFDLTKNEEVQLTADKVNNMEPTRSGSYTVWQRWNGNNWDIVLYDGYETKFISESPLHDIAPKVKGDLVMWNRLALDNTQTIELYDILSGEYTTISDDEGGALSNPRMVLVYETQFTNGDIVTKGYDFDTGKITSLANNPSELPAKLPEPDATGETRALLQPKNPAREDADLSDTIFPPSTGPGDGTSSSSTALATSSAYIQLNQGDLIIPAVDMSTALGTLNSASTTSVAALTLDMTPPSIVSTSTPWDLVVPPYVEQLTESTMESSE